MEGSRCKPCHAGLLASNIFALDYDGHSTAVTLPAAKAYMNFSASCTPFCGDCWCTRFARGSCCSRGHDLLTGQWPHLSAIVCRSMPGHYSPWGSFVGGLTKRMKHMGLPLGRPSPTPLGPEDAAMAARHKQAALEALSHRSARHAAEAAEVEFSVRQPRPLPQPSWHVLAESGTITHSNSMI